MTLSRNAANFVSFASLLAASLDEKAVVILDVVRGGTPALEEEVALCAVQTLLHLLTGCEQRVIDDVAGGSST